MTQNYSAKSEANGTIKLAHRVAPAECDIHDDAPFRNGFGGGHFYWCGCVWDARPGKVVDGQAGPWFRGMVRDER